LLGRDGDVMRVLHKVHCSSKLDKKKRKKETEEERKGKEGEERK
jgi:hypothetical protein